MQRPHQLHHRKHDFIADQTSGTPGSFCMLAARTPPTKLALLRHARTPPTQLYFKPARHASLVFLLPLPSGLVCHSVAHSSLASQKK